MIRSIRQRTEAVRTIARLLPAAEVEAQRDGRSEPAAEDLVLAALELPDGTASRALARLGCDLTVLGLDRGEVVRAAESEIRHGGTAP